MRHEIKIKKVAYKKVLRRTTKAFVIDNETNVNMSDLINLKI